jgi:hypothetical protein
MLYTLARCVSNDDDLSTSEKVRVAPPNLSKSLTKGSAEVLLNCLCDSCKAPKRKPLLYPLLL